MIRNFKDLLVYKKALEQAMRFFKVSRRFPKEEQYSLTVQIRRSSGSVCTNIAEAWKKRRYPAHFVSKLADAVAEATETMIWLDFSFHCDSINTANTAVHNQVSSEYEQIGKMLGAMISAPEKFSYDSKKFR